MTKQSVNAVSPSVPLDYINPVPPNPGEPAASPPSTKQLLPSMLITALVLFATYGGLISILLPSQIALLDEANKVANLAIVTTTSFVFTLFAQPIAGALSDRTRSRFGRRAPYMVLGALVGGIMMFGIGSLRDILWITVFWVVIQVALNFLQSPLTTITADRFPRSRRGGASAMMGLGQQLGMTLGVMAAGTLASNLGMAYSYFGIAVIVTTVLFVIFNRDWSSKEAGVEPFSISQFFKNFWVSPKQHPDFAWAFAARFAFILGYFVVMTYQLYLLTDYIGLSLEGAQAAVVQMTLVGLVPTVLSITISGFWSDKVGRRKIFIYGATVIMTIGLLIPFFMPTLTGMLIMAAVNGVGFGAYMSVDAALMTEVLPSEGTSAGKDLGILNVATNIPQAMSPAIAGIIIGAAGYSWLFIFAIIFVIIAAFVIVPIKAVR